MNVEEEKIDLVVWHPMYESMDEKVRPLGLAFPAGLFSLSHIALPFPMNDSLYGMQPDPTENFGVNLGAIAPRGERNTLIVSLDELRHAWEGGLARALGWDAASTRGPG